jgi:hypothetical protein
MNNAPKAATSASIYAVCATKALPCMPTYISACCCRKRSQQQKKLSHAKSQVLSVCFSWYRISPTVDNSKKEEAYPGWQTQSEGSSLPVLTVVVPEGQLVHAFVVQPKE